MANGSKCFVYSNFPFDYMSKSKCILILILFLFSSTIVIADDELQKNKEVKDKVLKFIGTAYCLNGKNCPKGKYGGKTATGKMVALGIIAVDPRIIPLKTYVEIIAPASHAGIYYSADTGGAIKGNRIDIWLPSRKEAISFGRRLVHLRLLGKIPNEKTKQESLADNHKSNTTDKTVSNETESSRNKF